MVSFLFFLELVVSHFGLLKLVMLPSICLRVLWALVPLFSRVGMSLRVLIGILLPMGCLLHLMFGLMVVLFVMRFLVSAFAGAGVHARLHGDSWRYRRWGHLDDLGLTPDGLSSSCVGFSSLPGPLQTVQRAEFWSVVFALQATNAVHLGVDNLNVVRHVGRLLKGLSSVRPLELVDDGDLIILIRKVHSFSGEGTVCISEVKGHADEGLVRGG